MIKIKGYHHTGIVVKDLARAEGFYCGVLGMQKLPRPEFSIKGAWLEMSGGQQMHLMELAEPEIKTARHVALVVENFDDTVRILKQHNVVFNTQPTKRADGSDACSIQDGEGNGIEITTPVPARV